MQSGMRDKSRLLHFDVTEKIIRGFFDVYDDLGPGLLEAVYHRAMQHALADLGLSCQTDVHLPVYFRGRLVGNYRADLIVESKVIVETKAVSQIVAAHEMQLFNYMKIAHIEVGMILNFGDEATFQRYVLTANQKKPASRKPISS